MYQESGFRMFGLETRRPSRALWRNMCCSLEKSACIMHQTCRSDNFGFNPTSARTRRSPRCRHVVTRANPCLSILRGECDSTQLTSRSKMPSGVVSTCRQGYPPCWRPGMEVCAAQLQPRQCVTKVLLVSNSLQVMTPSKAVHLSQGPDKASRQPALRV
jgi:hypothetical protein